MAEQNAHSSENYGSDIGLSGASTLPGRPPGRPAPAAAGQAATARVRNSEKTETNRARSVSSDLSAHAQDADNKTETGQYAVTCCVPVPAAN